MLIIKILLKLLFRFDLVRQDNTGYCSGRGSNPQHATK